MGVFTMSQLDDALASVFGKGNVPKVGENMYALVIPPGKWAKESVVVTFEIIVDGDTVRLQAFKMDAKVPEEKVADVCLFCNRWNTENTGGVLIAYYDTDDKSVQVRRTIPNVSALTSSYFVKNFINFSCYAVMKFFEDLAKQCSC